MFFIVDNCSYYSFESYIGGYDTDEIIETHIQFHNRDIVVQELSDYCVVWDSDDYSLEVVETEAIIKYLLQRDWHTIKRQLALGYNVKFEDLGSCINGYILVDNNKITIRFGSMDGIKRERDYTEYFIEAYNVSIKDRHEGLVKFGDNIVDCKKVIKDSCPERYQEIVHLAYSREEKLNVFSGNVEFFYLDEESRIGVSVFKEFVMFDIDCMCVEPIDFDGNENGDYSDYVTIHVVFYSGSRSSMEAICDKDDFLNFIENREV